MIDRRETGGGDPDGSAGGAGGRVPRGINRWREVARIGLRTLFFYLLLLAILLLWHGGGLFIYENF